MYILLNIILYKTGLLTYQNIYFFIYIQTNTLYMLFVLRASATKEKAIHAKQNDIKKKKKKELTCEFVIL